MGIWDRGGIVWSVERGGIGPGYEQAIQILVMELVRELHILTPQEVSVRFRDMHKCPVVARLTRDLGFTGAQVGAAYALAARFTTEGYIDSLVEAHEHGARMIMVCRVFPRWQGDAV